MESRRKRRSWLGLSLRQLALLALGAAAGIFAWINAQPTDVDFLVTRVRIPTSLVILVPLLLGFLLGWIEGRRPRRATRTGEEPGRPEGGSWDGAAEPTSEGGPSAGEGDGSGGEFVP